MSEAPSEKVKALTGDLQQLASSLASHAYASTAGPTAQQKPGDDVIDAEFKQS